MVTIIGADREGVVEFQGVRWWAESGLIHWEIVDTGEAGAVTVRDALMRAKGINDMVGNSKASRGISQHSDKVAEHQNFIDSIINLCKKAQYQGRPELASHVKQMQRDKTSRMVVVPGFNSRM